jgi:hypothetical protein
MLPFAQSVVDTMIKPEPLANASSLSEAALFFGIISALVAGAAVRLSDPCSGS